METAKTGPGAPELDGLTMKAEALLRRQRERREEVIRREQREADAAIVRAAAPEIARRLMYHKTQTTLTETQAEIVVLDLVAAILEGK